MIKSVLNLFKKKEWDASAAYDLWANAYDNEQANLMMEMDEVLLEDLLSGISLADKDVADIGCGTGRHWQKLISLDPASIKGFDVSEEMLSTLVKKFPDADTQLVEDEKISLPDNSIDVIISTLTIAHIEHLGSALNEWKRILRPNGMILCTDYHPTLLAAGGKRTFSHQGKTVTIKNYIHPISEVTKSFAAPDFEVLAIREPVIDEQFRSYYERRNALSTFEQFKGTPFIYGLLIRKNDPAE